MYLLFLFFGILILVDIVIYFFKRELFFDKEKMKIVRGTELILMSPLIVAGIILVKGDKVQDNFLFFFGFSAIIILIGCNKLFLNKNK